MQADERHHMHSERGSLLSEQMAYYGALAPDYEHNALKEWEGNELDLALDLFRAEGDVLEIACGPGTWTGRLAEHARSVTAIDGSAQMLARAAARLGERPVRLIQADVFAWEPEQSYDVVAFGFFLSHVPLECFEEFWEFLARCLKPDGRVFFIDDAHRNPEELIEGESSSIVLRRLKDGRTFRIVKVPHTPAGLERRLAEIGWQVKVTPTSNPSPFFWGEGRPA